MIEEENDKNIFVFYAHSFGEDRREWQLLDDHLQNTARIAASLGVPLGLEEHAYICGRLHDLGKYSLNFQRRIRGENVKADHATAGAQEIVQLLANSPYRLFGDAYAYCIAGHHTGLPDYGTSIDHEGDSTLLARLKRLLDPYDAYRTELDPSTLPIASMPKIIRTTEKGLFSLSFFIRMLYSILVDADYLETEQFYQLGLERGSATTIPEILETFQKHLQSFQFPETPINKLRDEIMEACRQKAELPQGLFSLTVPTGGGKTLSSMLFALNHAKKHKLERVIYVIPYTSIIEQNARVFREALGEDIILEHHSNFDWEDFSTSGKISKTSENSVGEEADDAIASKLKLASENWDIPIVVTTNVQFFESLFAARSSRSRKVHNMTNSIIIFDEAQILPLQYLQPCMLAVAELVQNYKSTAVLCTATQPELQRFIPESLKITEITADPAQLYNAFKRVELVNLGSIEDEELIDRLNEHEQVLCIVNTRKHANKLFQLLPEEGRFHLSTLMTPTHRRAAIQTIRERLAQGQTCRLVSTQLIEAGVDLDFPVGFRALAGLDSIIQAGGRVNRNRRSKTSHLYVFEPITDAIKRAPGFIQQTGDVARQILRRWQGSDPICLDAIRDYYESLYSIQAKTTFDSAGVLACFEKPNSRELDFDFRKASELFKLIEQDTIGIVVPIDEKSNILVEKLKWAQHPSSLLRSLQSYTVNVYQHEFRLLLESGKINMIDHVPVLFDPYHNYNKDYGLIVPTSSGGDALFFDS